VKNIILLSDGTGNSAAKIFKTNVWRFYEALDLNCPDQIALYDDGVGTASVPALAMLGGAFGWGLKRNVLDLYFFACRNYRKDDRLFLFGFSRGAFTARVLAGLIADQGLIQNEDGAELKRLASWAYRRYRRRYVSTKGLVKPLRWVRDRIFSTWDAVRGKRAYDEVSRVKQPEIAFLGMWDTVDAYGLPIDELTQGWDHWVWPLSMPNQQLSRRVRKACHALSLDDERRTFFPVLWDERDEQVSANSTHLDQERLSQVWFAGVHANVGGGYPDDTLAYTSLTWMATEAVKHGLRFMPHLCKAASHVPFHWFEKATPCAPLHDSRRGPGSYYRYQPRKIAKLIADRDAGVWIERVKIHESVFDRITNGVDGYSPIVLPARYAVVTRAGTVLDGDQPNEHANPYEHSTQALARSHRQESVWNIVWWRKWVYFATVAFTLVLLVLPFVPDAYQVGLLDYRLPIMSAGVALLGNMVPGFLAAWLEYYETYPLRLIALAAIITLFIATSSKLKQRIGDGMRQLWRGTGTSPTGPAPLPMDLLARLRRAPAMLAMARFMTAYFWPTLFGVTMLILLAGAIPIGLVRATFDVENVSGLMCHDNPTDAGPVLGPWVFTFDPKRFCHATGIALQQDARYSVEIFPEDFLRYSYRPSSVVYPLFPLRRVLQADWFVPVARVGSTGAEHYPLTSHVSAFTAQRSGQLMVFLNDLVLPWPKWDAWYADNPAETACIRVTRISSDEREAPSTMAPPPRCVDSTGNLIVSLAIKN
jgi:uncharacterized protein (DUF2235 family)